MRNDGARRAPPAAGETSRREASPAPRDVAYAGAALLCAAVLVHAVRSRCKTFWLQLRRAPAWLAGLPAEYRRNVQGGAAAPARAGLRSHQHSMVEPARLKVWVSWRSAHHRRRIGIRIFACGTMGMRPGALSTPGAAAAAPVVARRAVALESALGAAARPLARLDPMFMASHRCAALQDCRRGARGGRRRRDRALFLPDLALHSTRGPLAGGGSANSHPWSAACAPPRPARWQRAPATMFGSSGVRRAAAGAAAPLAPAAAIPAAPAAGAASPLAREADRLACPPTEGRTSLENGAGATTRWSWCCGKAAAAAPPAAPPAWCRRRPPAFASQTRSRQASPQLEA